MSAAIINKPKEITPRTERAAFSKYDSKIRSKHLESSFLNLNDYERIRKNATVLSDVDIRNQRKIQEEQKQTQLEGTKNLKERMLQYDRVRTDRNNLTDIEKDAIELNKTMKEKAQKIIDENTDEAKEMNKLIMYAKVASIRDRQLEEQKMIQGEYKRHNEKLDLMMEIERLKELQLQEERERNRKEQQYAGSLVIIDQIKDRDLERMKQLEQKEKERIIMLRQVQELENEEKRNFEMKKKQGEKLAKEVIETNTRAAEIKEKKKIEEKELELKIHEYNVNKVKKEEEDIAEKKRVQEEKEREVQKLRDRQERAKDKQSELDFIRAKRAFEESERQARDKAKKELEKRKNMVDELMKANEQQKIDRELRLAEQAKIEKDGYNRIIEAQLKAQEEERRKEEERVKLRYDHNGELRRQIKVREELERQRNRELLEEGRKMKQKVKNIKENIERIKEEKLNNLKSLNMQEKYVTPLVKYKLNV
mmetsp:Transcript_15054/g.15589  ORF Transcript_15054/g.15589 Transcript_15054/m.15589 type:complete len:480 (+) Transcript_15054:14-1453(+)